MIVYKIKNDFAYTDLSIKRQTDVRRLSGYKGQRIEGEWEEDLFCLSEDKLQKGTVADFDARCYGSIMILRQEYQLLFDAQLNAQAQYLPVCVQGISGAFVFVNILGTMPSINFEGMDFKQTMTMMRGKEIVFRQEIIKTQNIFRDEKAPNYFCTKNLVQFFHDSGIIGLKFEVVGEAV
jgi:hypothetical protein